MISVEQYRAVVGLFNSVKQSGSCFQESRGMKFLSLLFWLGIGFLSKFGPWLPLLMWLVDEGAVGHFYAKMTTEGTWLGWNFAKQVFGWLGGLLTGMFYHCQKWKWKGKEFFVGNVIMIWRYSRKIWVSCVNPAFHLSTEKEVLMGSTILMICLMCIGIRYKVRFTAPSTFETYIKVGILLTWFFSSVTVFGHVSWRYAIENLLMVIGVIIVVSLEVIKSALVNPSFIRLVLIWNPKAMWISMAALVLILSAALVLFLSVLLSNVKRRIKNSKEIRVGNNLGKDWSLLKGLIHKIEKCRPGKRKRWLNLNRSLVDFIDKNYIVLEREALSTNERTMREYMYKKATETFNKFQSKYECKRGLHVQDMEASQKEKKSMKGLHGKDKRIPQNNDEVKIEKALEDELSGEVEDIGPDLQEENLPKTPTDAPDLFSWEKTPNNASFSNPESSLADSAVNVCGGATEEGHEVGQQRETGSKRKRLNPHLRAKKAAKRLNDKKDRTTHCVPNLPPRNKEPPQEEINIISHNCNNLDLSTHAQIVQMTEDHNPDVLFLQETWKRDGFKGRDYKIPGYFAEFRNRKRGQKARGGTAVFWKKTLNATVWNPSFDDPDNEWVQNERIWILLKNSNGNGLAVCGAYLGVNKEENTQWNNNMYQVISSEIEKVRRMPTNYKIVLTGDFNGHIGNALIKGNKSDINDNGHRLINLADSLGFQIVNGHELTKGLWTYMKAPNIKSVLDYVLLEDSVMDSFKSLQIMDGQGPGRERPVISDHAVLILTLKMCVSHVVWNNTKRKKWKINDATDWKTFAETLDKDITDKYSGVPDDDHNQKYQAIVNSLLQVGEKIIGYRKAGKGGSFFKGSELLQQKIEERRQSFNDWCLASGNEDPGFDNQFNILKKYQIYLKLTKEARDLLIKERREERHKLGRLISKKGRSSSIFWNEARGFSETQGNPCLRDNNQNLISDPPSVLRFLFCYFDKLFTKLKSGRGPRVDLQTEVHNDQGQGEGKRFDSTLCREISLEELKKTIKNLDSGISAAADGIPNEFLKFAGENFIRCLLDLFNCILKAGEVVIDWNTGVMFIMHKKGDKTDLKNYRGITINPNIAKLFCRILESRLMVVVEAESLLGECQGAVRKGRHTTDNIFILSVLLEKARKLKLYDTSVAFVDMKKAFDMVNREKLWELLEKKGLGGRFVSLLKSMYKDSKIFVEINGERTPEPVKPGRGLKQGCVLSPILFALYLTDLGEELQKTNLGLKLKDTIISCLFFADDICLIGKDGESLLTLLNKTQDYADRYGLEINPLPSKSEVICFQQEIQTWPLRNCEGQLVASLNQALQYKYLGIPITVQGKKHFLYRIKDIIVGANQHAGRVKSLAKDSFNRIEVGEALWENVSLPSLLYGSECLTLTKTELGKLEASQRGLAKWLLGHDRNAAGVAASVELGWKSIKHLYEEKKLLMYGRLKFFTEEDRWIKEAFSEVQSGGWDSSWWKEMEAIKSRTNLDAILKGIPQESWSKSKVKSEIKSTIASHSIESAKVEISEKSTLNAFPIPPKKSWFKRREYISDTKGSRLISKVRAGNYGVGNTYQRIKDCLLCDAPNGNHESHLIMKCKELREARQTTDIVDFLSKNEQDQMNEHGYSAMRSYLDPKKDVIETLLKRAQNVQYMLNIWESKCQEKLGKPAKTYCYCKEEEWGKMVECDGCQDWFHYACAELEEDFHSLEEWYCENCSSVSQGDALCVCNAHYDATRITIKCRGMCGTEYHPECLGFDVDEMCLSSRVTWRCPSC